MIWRRILAWGAWLGLLHPAYADLDADPVKPDEQLVIFPAVCWPDAHRRWQIELHAWIYEAPLVEARSAWRWLFGSDADVGEADQVLARERLQWFLVDNERGKRLRFEVGGVERIAASTGADGHAHDRMTMPPEWQPDATPPARIVSEAPDGRRFEGRVACLPPRGLSVISDIDDTIKISEVHDRQALLANTFLRPYRAVEGVTAFYTRLAGARGARFHYLSASPWQLYPPLEAFREAQGLPEGTYHLKHFRLKDRSFFALFDDPFAYKTELIEGLIDKLGERELVLVGDSGERDPEVYGEIARRYPERVKAIVIRDVVPATTDTGERRRAAFAGVSPERVYWLGERFPDGLATDILQTVGLP